MNKLCSYLICLFILSVSANAQSGFTNVLITPTGCTEPSICIDPTNPARVVAATNCSYSYFSSDSGQTWAPCNNLSITPGVWCYDPCIVADYSGNFYYFHNYCIQPSTPRVTVQKSFNGGATWSFDNDVNGLYDKEMCCVRPSTNELYSTFIPITGGYTNVGFSKSNDGGVSWTFMSFINAGTYSGTQWGAAPAVGPNPNELYVVWENSSGVYFQKSYTNGNSWQPVDMQITNWLNTTNGFDCMPSIGCDISGGPFTGYIYIVWWEKDVNGTDTDIYLAKSNNGGSFFTISTIASDINTDQKIPQLTIDQTNGNVYVVYYSQSGTSSKYDVNLAYSTDGCSTFVNTPVSQNPATLYNWYHHYIGNSAVNGVIRPAWTSTDSLYTALISEAELTAWMSVQNFNVQSALNIYPNPSNGIFYMNSDYDGTVEIMNAAGQIILTQAVTRKDEFKFDISAYADGLYFVTLVTDQGRASQRLIKK